MRTLPASIWITSHHKGVITERANFLKMLHAFASRIDEREQRLLAMLSAAPRSLDDLVRERLLYPADHDDLWIDCAERRSIVQHLDELVVRGLVTLDGDARYRLGASAHRAA